VGAVDRFKGFRAVIDVKFHACLNLMLQHADLNYFTPLMIMI